MNVKKFLKIICLFILFVLSPVINAATHEGVVTEVQPFIVKDDTGAVAEYVRIVVFPPISDSPCGLNTDLSIALKGFNSTTQERFSDQHFSMLLVALASESKIKFDYNPPTHFFMDLTMCLVAGNTVRINNISLKSSN